MTTSTDGVAQDLAPGGVLRAAINLGNPMLAQGTSEAPAGVTVDIDLVEELKADGFVADALRDSS
jgi:hypothetical protein